MKWFRFVFLKKKKLRIMEQPSSEWSFTLGSDGGNGSVRRGVWRTTSGHSIETPCFCFPTQFGYVPTLTQEMLMKHVLDGNDPIVYGIPVAHFVDCVEVIESFNRGLGKFCGLDEKRSIVLLLNNDAMEPFYASKISEGHVVLRGEKGHVRLSPQGWVRCVRTFRPELAVSPSRELEPNCSARAKKKGATGGAGFWKGQKTSWGDAWSSSEVHRRVVCPMSEMEEPFAESFCRTFDSSSSSDSLWSQCPHSKLRIVVGDLSIQQALTCGADVICSARPFLLAKAGCALMVQQSDGNEISLPVKGWEDRRDPIAEGCACYTCKRHTRGYIQHLINTEEMLANSLLAIHNVYTFKTALKAK